MSVTTVEDVANLTGSIIRQIIRESPAKPEDVVELLARLIGDLSGEVARLSGRADAAAMLRIYADALDAAEAETLQ
jgi:hypothetical protein